jgi:uncharacterized protein (TIGR02328 family)
MDIWTFITYTAIIKIRNIFKNYLTNQQKYDIIYLETPSQIQLGGFRKMRIWHKELIYVLPKQQLIGQWRELSSMAGKIYVDGFPNHILVNKINDYEIKHFITFAYLVKQEMEQRGYKPKENVWNKIQQLKPDWKYVSFYDLFKDWHNKRYLTQCYYNLQEKYDCGSVEDEDWFAIHKKFIEFIET